MCIIASNTRYIVHVYTMERLYCGHHWDPSNCPLFRGSFVQNCHNWDKSNCPYLRGVLISGVSALRGSTVYMYVGTSITNKYMSLLLMCPFLGKCVLIGGAAPHLRTT